LGVNVLLGVNAVPLQSCLVVFSAKSAKIAKAAKRTYLVDAMHAAICLRDIKQDEQDGQDIPLPFQSGHLPADSKPRG
jgi:hypothetical protein